MEFKEVNKSRWMTSFNTAEATNEHVNEKLATCFFSVNVNFVALTALIANSPFQKV